MREIPFIKYQGTGNDFVMIDNREKPHLTINETALIEQICNRKFGIGADGLILLQNKQGFDFEMIYFNADGRQSSMCGNGGRCIVAFAKELGIIEQNCHFMAIDGEHEAVIHENGWVDLKIGNVPNVEQGDGYFILDTGSPHYVVFVEDLSDINVVESGQLIRYSDRFRKEGINVNFVEKEPSGVVVGTYERGVENETLSCGTGVTAAAIATFLKDGSTGKKEIPIGTKGGHLKVKLERNNGIFQNIWLCGPATKVFSGTYSY
ncbi:MAG: diaminopimelate epimerase [Bacteroidota bacterium]